MRSDRYYVCPSCHFGDYLSDLTTLPERLLGRHCPRCQRRTLKVCRDTTNHEWRKVEGPYSRGPWSHKDDYMWRSSDGLEWHGPPDEIYYWTCRCRFILQTTQPYYQKHREPPGLCPRYLYNWQILNSAHNNLSELPPGVFDGLSSLQSLDLQDNLSELPPGVCLTS